MAVNKKLQNDAEFESDLALADVKEIGEVKKKKTKAKTLKTVKAVKKSEEKLIIQTDNEEIASETEVQKNLDATQLYLNEIGFSPLLTPEEEVHFARLARKGDEKGRKRMIESNLRFSG